MCYPIISGNKEIQTCSILETEQLEIFAHDFVISIFEYTKVAMFVYKVPEVWSITCGKMKLRHHVSVYFVVLVLIAQAHYGGMKNIRGHIIFLVIPNMR